MRYLQSFLLLLLSTSLLVPAFPAMAQATTSPVTPRIETVAPQQTVVHAVARVEFPDSPQPQAPALDSTASVSTAIAPLPQPTGTLNLHQRFIFQARTTFGPGAFLSPAYEAGFVMAHPPSHYPRDWSDGGAAFGRNYGAGLARHTTAGLTHFAVAAIDREDPRYYPCTSTRYASRALHALMFTLVDRSDSGHRTLALSNFAGSLAGGYIGMAYEPAGFDDNTHAYQRAAVELSDFGAHNLIVEFSPEITHLFHKLHFPDRLANSLLPEKPVASANKSEAHLSSRSQ
jgi:hypothetical protein